MREALLHAGPSSEKGHRILKYPSELGRRISQNHSTGLLFLAGLPGLFCLSGLLTAKTLLIICEKYSAELIFSAKGCILLEKQSEMNGGK